MNSSRRGTGRKNQNVPRENTQDISQFVHRRSKEELVEIDDDDEVQDLTDQVNTWSLYFCKYYNIQMRWVLLLQYICDILMYQFQENNFN